MRHKYTQISDGLNRNASIKNAERSITAQESLLHTIAQARAVRIEGPPNCVKSQQPVCHYLLAISGHALFPYQLRANQLTYGTKLSHG